MERISFDFFLWIKIYNTVRRDNFKREVKITKVNYVLLKILEKVVSNNFI